MQSTNHQKPVDLRAEAHEPGVGGCSHEGCAMQCFRTITKFFWQSPCDHDNIWRGDKYLNNNEQIVKYLTKRVPQVHVDPKCTEEG